VTPFQTSQPQMNPRVMKHKTGTSSTENTESGMLVEKLSIPQKNRRLLRDKSNVADPLAVECEMLVLDLSTRHTISRVPRCKSNVASPQDMESQMSVLDLSTTQMNHLDASLESNKLRRKPRHKPGISGSHVKHR